MKGTMSNVGNEIEIKRNGRPMKVTLIAENIGEHTTRSGNKDYWLKCNVTGEWCFCFEERLQKLVKRYGSLEALSEKHVSRDGGKKLDPSDPLLVERPKATRERKPKAESEVEPTATASVKPTKTTKVKKEKTPSSVQVKDTPQTEDEVDAALDNILNEGN